MCIFIPHDINDLLYLPCTFEYLVGEKNLRMLLCFWERWWLALALRSFMFHEAQSWCCDWPLLFSNHQLRLHSAQLLDPLKPHVYTSLNSFFQVLLVVVVIQNWMLWRHRCKFTLQLTWKWHQLKQRIHLVQCVFVVGKEPMRLKFIHILLFFPPYKC